MTPCGRFPNFGEGRNVDNSTRGEQVFRWAGVHSCTDVQVGEIRSGWGSVPIVKGGRRRADPCPPCPCHPAPTVLPPIRSGGRWTGGLLRSIGGQRSNAGECGRVDRWAGGILTATPRRACITSNISPSHQIRKTGVKLGKPDKSTAVDRRRPTTTICRRLLRFLSARSPEVGVPKKNTQKKLTCVRMPVWSYCSR